MSGAQKLEFDRSKLRQSLEAANKAAERQSNDTGERTPIAWLAEGMHTIRFFSDPESLLFRDLMIHTVQYAGEKSQCICPDFLRGRGHKDVPPTCEICRIAEEKNNKRFLGAKNRSMAYGRIYDTRNPSDYFKKEETYVILYNSFLKRALMAFSNAMLQSPGAEDYIMQMYDPKSSSPATFVDVRRGGVGSGSVSITPIPVNTVPPIELGPWYRPLSTVWIPESFNEDRYKATLDLVHRSYDEDPDTKSQVQAPEAPTKPTSEPKTQPASPPPPPPTPPVSPPPAPEAAQPQSPPPSAPINLEEIRRKIEADRQAQQQPQTTAEAWPGQPMKVMSKSQREVDFSQPDLAHVIERKCWKKYSSTDMVCVRCPISTDCLYESLA